MECKRKTVLCDGFCPCDDSGYCISLCDSDTDCSCSEKCFNGGCRSVCSVRNKCPERQICHQNVCIPGCSIDAHCGDDMVCSSRRCVKACKENSCGQDAACFAVRHRAICKCPSGYTGDPSEKCEPYECTKNEECSADEACAQGKCKNVCSGSCGINAICRSVNGIPQCSCPPNYLGNPKVECSKPPAGSCLRNPCGVSARCRDLEDGNYECTCPPNCAGNPHKQCFCGVMESCAYKSCGTNAQCHIGPQGEAECFCPRNYPNGDPNIECE